jgi:hypothetical protein
MRAVEYGKEIRIKRNYQERKRGETEFQASESLSHRSDNRREKWR